MKVNTIEKTDMKIIVNIPLAIAFHSLTSFNPMTPRKNVITVMPKTISNGKSPMIFVVKLKKSADDIAIKNRGIQSKESIKDNELIVISIPFHSLLKILFNFNKSSRTYPLLF
ncbi:hypothetical protein [Sporosarcina sp. SG10008]|uniref:hypothetical protein n=1 Tax=Sporosarcina sp. SG10008 TaxID=3373103 RepID=UPI00078E41D8|nr:hypothetical protein AZE41_07605 [Sporosarcina psychrophila]